MKQAIGRVFFLALAVVCSAAVPARADSFDTFTFNPAGISPFGPVITFTLPASPTPSYASPPPGPPYYEPAYFQLSDVAYSLNGVAQTPGLFEFDTHAGGPYDALSIYGPNDSRVLALILLNGYFFTGSASNPTFLLTNGNPLIGFNSIPEMQYEDAISIDPASSPVPEPGSWLLLGTGAAGALGLVRRRLFS